MGIWDPKHFLIHVQGAIHVIKEMELNTKFQEATEAVKTAMMDLVLAKMAYKDKLKKGRENDTPAQAVRAGKAVPDKAKNLRRAEGEEYLKPLSLQLRQHSTKSGRQGTRHRNEPTYSACRFSSFMEISLLTRLISPGRKL